VPVFAKPPARQAGAPSGHWWQDRMYPSGQSSSSSFSSSSSSSSIPSIVGG